MKVGFRLQEWGIRVDAASVGRRLYCVLRPGNDLLGPGTVKLIDALVC